METLLSYSGLLFLPLISALAFGLTTLMLRLIRLARVPGFRRRFDPEIGFLTRGPKLLVLSVVVLFVVVPTLIGVLLPPQPSRRTGQAVAVTQPVPETEASLEATEPAAQKSVMSIPPVPDNPAAPRQASVARRTPQTTPAPAPKDEVLRTLVPVALEDYRYRDTVQIAPAEVASAAFPEALASVDVLFVHAHPDDESIDFAVLMGALSREGLSIATLLLTDGESGVDRYPHRADYPGYESGSLSGEELRSVRVQEAANALSVLGADYYLRLGLPNHPYNGIADEMPLDEVLDAWGGEDVLVARIAGILRSVSPRLIVAPDLGSEAREHFEHEATGYLVREAVAQLAADGAEPGAYLASVDPFQRHLYQHTVAVPKTTGQRDLSEVQKAALSQHHTQADASVIGIRRLPAVEAEYYMPVYWDLEDSLGALLGLDDELLSRDSALVEVALAHQNNVGDGPPTAVE